MAVGVSGGDRLDAALRKIATQLEKAQKVDVGFMTGSTYPDGTSVPMVAAIQNFGAPAAGIPPRPFFSDMVKAQSPSWGGKITQVLKATDYDAKQTLSLMGEDISGALQDSIVAADYVPLKPETVNRKGFDKQLIDTGHMRNSVQYAVDGDVSDAPK